MYTLYTLYTVYSVYYKLVIFLMYGETRIKFIFSITIYDFFSYIYNSEIGIQKPG